MTEDFLIAIATMILFIAILITTAIIFSRYYRYVKKFTIEAEKGEVEVLICPRCKYTSVIKPRVGDYIGKATEFACPRDGERLVVYAMYIEKPKEKT